MRPPRRIPDPARAKATRPARPLALALALFLGAAIAATGCATLDQPADSTVRYDDGREMGDAGYFYDALSPYGQWVELSPYGLVWLPDGLGPGWSPYSQGFWTYSDYGWTWVDQEPWGWAPFHYGRWWLDPQYAWVWIPGTEWAPAWVAWRESDAYVAWAPLPPTIHWSFTVPLHSGGPDVAALPVTWWNVARPTDLVSSDLRERLVPTSDKLTALQRTEDRTRITARGDHPFNEGVRVDWVESRLGRPVPRYRVVDAPAGDAPKSGVLPGGEVSLFRPDLAHRQPHRGVPRPGNRERPPQAAVVPAPRGGALSTVGKGRAATPAVNDSTRLEAFVDGERQRMLREQEAERKAAAENGDDLDALGQRHAREARAFEAWAERQRQAGPAKGLRGVVRGTPRFDRKAAGEDRGASRATGSAADSSRAK